MTEEAVQDISFGANLLLEICRTGNRLQVHFGCPGDLVCHGIPAIQGSQIGVGGGHPRADIPSTGGPCSSSSINPSGDVIVPPRESGGRSWLCRCTLRLQLRLP